MLSHVGREAILCCIFIFCFQTHAGHDFTKDQTTSRANTLFDDADDIQRQLDNEVRDRLGQLKTVWVFHVPGRNSLQNVSPTTPSNELIVRFKRKIGYKQFRNIKKPVGLNESCLCGIGSNEKSGGVCKCGETKYYPNFKENSNTNQNIPKEEKEQECKESEPTQISAPPEVPEPELIPKWHFWNQQKWHETFKECGGHAQSPVNLPVEGLIHAKGARKLIFSNYDVKPNNLTVVNDGRRVVMYGTWPKTQWPLVYGGAAYSRRYLFHSLTVYWPSEHTIGGLYFPLESQVLHISAEYGSFDEAVKASTKDPMAFLGVVNIYKFANHSHPGVMTILHAAQKCCPGRTSIAPQSLDKFSEPFSDHVCYYGSLTVPPCTEAVLWLIRRRSLPLTRESTSMLHSILGPATTPFAHTGDIFPKMSIRMPQALNDRKIYAFL